MNMDRSQNDSAVGGWSPQLGINVNSPELKGPRQDGTQHHRPYISVLFMLASTLVGVVGCETEDERLVEVAREASNRQAEQNQEIARQNHELAEATNRLIAADAQSRQEHFALEHELQAERSAIGQERDEM